MINTSSFLGLPIKFQDICTIYPPKIKEVVADSSIISLYQILTTSIEDIEDLFDEQRKKNPNANIPDKLPTPLEFLLSNCFISETTAAMAQKAFECFIHEPVTFLYDNQLILIGSDENLSGIDNITKFRYLSNNNYFDFQNLIRESIGEAPITLPDPNENPITKKVKAAGRKRQRMAAKTAAKKGVRNTLTLNLGAICCMGIGLTPLNIGEMSYAAINVLTTLYQQKEKYQLDMDSIMAGANPKKVHPKYWIRENSDTQEIKI